MGENKIQVSGEFPRGEEVILTKETSVYEKDVEGDKIAYKVGELQAWSSIYVDRGIVFNLAVEENDNEVIKDVQLVQWTNADVFDFKSVMLVKLSDLPEKQ